MSKKDVTGGLPGPHPAHDHKASLREKLVYADDGCIYINSIHKRDVDVQTEIANIRRTATTAVRLEFVILSKIESIYAQNTAGLASISSGSNSPADSQTDRQGYLIKLMRDAARKGASDIHMVVSGKRTRIEFRIHGELTLESEISSEEGELMMSSLYNSMIDSSSDPNFDRGRRQQGRLRKAFAEQADVWSGA